MSGNAKADGVRPPHFIQPLELPGQEGQSTPDKPNALADLMAQAVLETESRGLSGDASDAKKDDPSKTACIKIDRPKKLPNFFSPIFGIKR